MDSIHDFFKYQSNLVDEKKGHYHFRGSNNLSYYMDRLQWYKEAEQKGVHTKFAKRPYANFKWIEPRYLR